MSEQAAACHEPPSLTIPCGVEGNTPVSRGAAMVRYEGCACIGWPQCFPWTSLVTQLLVFELGFGGSEPVGVEAGVWGPGFPVAGPVQGPSVPIMQLVWSTLPEGR